MMRQESIAKKAEWSRAAYFMIGRSRGERRGQKEAVQDMTSHIYYLTLSSPSILRAAPPLPHTEGYLVTFSPHLMG